MQKQWYHKIIQDGSGASFALLAAAGLAMLWANSPWHHSYFYFFKEIFWAQSQLISFGFTINSVINEGLMTLFFLLISLEIKHALVEGELHSLRKSLLPIIAAVGGMILPGCIYLAFNASQPALRQGWAIPISTDIAFSLAILVLLRAYVPTSLRSFVTLLSIIDDIGAIIVIALFYTDHLHFMFLIAMFGCISLLLLMNRFGVVGLLAYSIVGLLLWFCTINAGVHATIAGILLGLTMPLRVLEPSRLNKWVSFGILPLFALANAGVTFSDMTYTDLLDPITLGIACGLFIGKQGGIFLFSWLAVQLKIVKLPQDIQWRHLYGASILCGIGFTMSLFIGDLAFSSPDQEHFSMLMRLAVILGSFFSALTGYIILRSGPRRPDNLPL